jgi:acyl-CoA hydrolase
LFGRTVRDRAQMLAEIAHPSFRAELAEAADKLYHVPAFAVPELP